MWFANIETLEELKREYHRLAKKYHSDNSGNDEIMKQINVEYAEMFEKVKNYHYNSSGEKYTKETTEKASDFVNIVNTLNGCDNLTIEIIGSFIWVTGDTKTYKDIIKSLGFKFSKNKLAWYKAPAGYKKYNKKIYSMDEIRETFGVDEKIYTKGKAKIA